MNNYSYKRFNKPTQYYSDQSHYGYQKTKLNVANGIDFLPVAELICKTAVKTVIPYEFCISSGFSVSKDSNRTSVFSIESGTNHPTDFILVKNNSKLIGIEVFLKSRYYTLFRTENYHSVDAIKFQKCEKSLKDGTFESILALIGCKKSNSIFLFDMFAMPHFRKTYEKMNKNGYESVPMFNIKNMMNIGKLSDYQSI